MAMREESMATGESGFSETISHIEYLKMRPDLLSLAEESRLILKDSIDSSGIKLHSIESRVKEFDSIVRKMKTRGFSSVDEIRDLVGIRTVCLFKSDLNRIDKVVCDNFDVIDIDNKLYGDDPLIYKSIHYICKFPSKYNGPRYKKLHGGIIEIQVRTICMHAWAAASHYLEYKSEFDVPKELKMSLSALAGLFYVADEQYESLFSMKLKSRSVYSSMDLQNLKGIDLNLDTITEYMRKKFPNRLESDLASVSVFLKNLVDFGYKDIHEVDVDITNGMDRAIDREKISASDRNEELPIYYTLAISRISLHQANTEFAKFEFTPEIT